MTSPSEPLLAHLRNLIQTRGLNTAGLAHAAGLDRNRVRRVLAGREPLTVDELIVLAQALDLKPQDLGLTGVELEEPVEEEEPEEEDAEDAAGPEVSLADVLDPYGNHVRQLFEVGLGLGCDFFFHAVAAELEGSGVPAAVLQRYAGAELPIRLDAAFHADHQPRLEVGGVHLKLGFDALYDCFFPWTSIRQVRFLPAPPDIVEEDEEEEEEPPPRGAPFLRLVE